MRLLNPDTTSQLKKPKFARAFRQKIGGTSLENRNRDSTGRFVANPKTRGRPMLSAAAKRRSQRRRKELEHQRYLRKKFVVVMQKTHNEIDMMRERSRGLKCGIKNSAHIRNKNFQSNPRGPMDSVEIKNRKATQRVTACIMGRINERLGIPQDQRKAASEDHVIAAKVLYARYGLETALLIVAAYSRILNDSLVSRGLPMLPLMNRDFSDQLLAAIQGRPSPITIMAEDLWQARHTRDRVARAAFGVETVRREQRQFGRMPSPTKPRNQPGPFMKAWADRIAARRVMQ